MILSQPLPTRLWLRLKRGVIFVLVVGSIFAVWPLIILIPAATLWWQHKRITSLSEELNRLRDEVQTKTREFEKIESEHTKTKASSIALSDLRTSIERVADATKVVDIRTTDLQASIAQLRESTQSISDTLKIVSSSVMKLREDDLERQSQQGADVPNWRPVQMMHRSKQQASEFESWEQLLSSHRDWGDFPNVVVVCNLGFYGQSQERHYPVKSHSVPPAAWIGPGVRGNAHTLTLIAAWLAAQGRSEDEIRILLEQYRVNLGI